MAGWTSDSATKRIYPTDTANDDLIVGATSTEWSTGTELKMFFDKSKAALRGGSITNSNHNDASRGNFSFAWGSNSHSASGADAVALGNNAIASGSYSFATAGSGATASGDSSVAFQGGTASGTNSFSGNGNGATASGTYATAFGGGATASGRSTFAVGPSSAINASRYAQFAQGGCQGEAQYNRFITGRNTTDATAVPLLFEGGYLTSNTVTLTGANTNVLTVPVSKAHKFVVQVIARSTTSDAHASWEIKGSIVRYSSGSAKFISTPSVVSDKETAAAAWDCAVTIDTSNSTNNYLAITVTGAAATTIRWAGTIATIEFP